MNRQCFALKELKRLAIERARKRYSNVPEHALVINRYNDQTANGLTRCIIDFIRFNGGLAERVNCTGRILDQRKQYIDALGFCRTVGSTKWIPTTGQRGTADISAVFRGVSLRVEVKAGHDRQSPAQAAYQRQIEAAGGLYFIAKDFESFYRWFCEKFMT